MTLQMSIKDIQDAFTYFERMGFKRPTNTILADNLSEAEWLDIYKLTPVNIFREACKLVVKSVRFWPKPLDMSTAIDEVYSKTRYKSEALPMPSRRGDEKASMIIRKAFKTGNVKAMLKAGMTKEFKSFVTSLYPDINEDMILKNYGEFMQLYENKKYPCDYKLVSWFDKKTGYLRLAVTLD